MCSTRLLCRDTLNRDEAKWREIDDAGCEKKKKLSEEECIGSLDLEKGKGNLIVFIIAHLE